DDFLQAPFLQHVITDQHFSQRDRQGRTIAFLGRIMKDWNKIPRAIAVDERTAVCIDANGIAEVLGTNRAYFVRTDASKNPETFAVNTPITWHHDGKAMEVSAISATTSNNRFNVDTFEPVSTLGLEKYWWSVVSGNWIHISRP